MIDWAGRRRQPCPNCEHGPKDDALSITPRTDGSYIAHCFRCDAVFFSDDHKPLATAPRIRAVVPQQREVLSDYGRNIWGACEPVSGPARAYLDARGCRIPPSDGDLRWNPAHRHPSGYVGPALVGLVTHAETREPMTLLSAWTLSDGRKADCNPPRLFLAGHRKVGGVIRLWPDEAVTTGLLVAEGIETALSAAHDFAPAWAALDAGNLASLPVLQGIETLVVAADHDDAGLRGATACADRWAAAGVDVHVIAPVAARTDWNDNMRAAA